MCPMDICPDGNGRAPFGDNCCSCERAPLKSTSLKPTKKPKKPTKKSFKMPKAMAKLDKKFKSWSKKLSAILKSSKRY